MTSLGEKKAKGMAIGPTVWIGKSGITPPVVAEIKKQLKKTDVIKVKMLQPFIKESGKVGAAESIASATDSEVIQKVGFVIVLGRKEKSLKH